MTSRQRSEQRSGYRVAMQVVVEVTAADRGNSFEGVSRDLSLGGMFVETTTPSLFGARVQLVFPRPRPARPLLVPGTVRWTSAEGMGVQFGSLGARETHVIAETVRAAGS